MSTNAYEAVIGLEVHCQLRTETKAFSPESASFGAAPNEHVDPISLGHPGTLPLFNESVVDFTLRMGLATHCKIAPKSVFARKHYFYPDLPKGYQISQYETPICTDGYLDLDPEIEPDDRRRIRITRIHMEEDAGKSLHDQDPYHTLLDYNRCGVPLIEIVSEPDLRSAHDAARYVQRIRQIVRYLRICDGNMEEGSLRCDANVSVRQKGDPKLGTKTEVKNMNSFRNVERALKHEITRQCTLLRQGERVVQETLLWDSDRRETRSMRSKEEAHDYRYFPDPDLVPVVVTGERLAKIRAELPEMPDARQKRYVTEWGLPEYDAALLTEDRGVADYFEATLEYATNDPAMDLKAVAKSASNFVMTNVLRVLKISGASIEAFPVDPKQMAGLISLRVNDYVNSSGAQEIFDAMLVEAKTAAQIAAERDLLQVSDTSLLVPVIDKVLESHPGQLKQYLDGKTGLVGFFIGQVMKSFPGSPDPKIVRSLLIEKIEAIRIS